MARALNKHDNMPMAKKLALKMLAAPTVATSNMSANVTQPAAMKNNAGRANRRNFQHVRKRVLERGLRTKTEK